MSPTRLFIAALPSNTSQTSLAQHFRNDSNITNYILRSDKGFAFIDVESEPERFIDKWHKTDFDGSTISIELARSNPRNDRDRNERGSERYPPLDSSTPFLTRRILITELSTRAKQVDLEDFLEDKAIHYTYCKAHLRRDGEAVVELTNLDDVPRAIKLLDYASIRGTPMRAEEDYGHQRRKRSLSPRRR